MIICRNLIFVIYTCICLLVSIPCWADPSLLDPSKTTITRTEHNLIVETTHNGVVNKQTFLLVHVPKEMPMFHWTSESNYARWLSQGRLDEGEVKFLSTPTVTKLNHYGPGVYASSSPVDSKTFGVKSVVFEMPEDFDLVQGAIQDPDMHELLRRNGIKGTKVTGSWYTFFDHEPLQKVRTQTGEDLIKYLNANPSQKPTKEEVKILSQTFAIPLGDWLEKIDEPLYRLLNGKKISPIEIQKITAYYFDESFLVTNRKFSEQFSKALSPQNRGEVVTHELISLAKRNKDYEYLIELDQKYGPLTATEELKSEFPKLHTLLSGKLLSKTEKAELTSFLKESYGLLRSKTPLTEALMSQMGPDVRSHLLASFNKAQNESSIKNVLVQASRSWGLDLSRLDESLVDSGSTLFPKGIIPPKSHLSSSAQDLLRSFEFIDFYDLLNGFATDNGNIIHAYDAPGKTPLIDRWKSASISSKDTDIESIQNLLEQTDSSKVRNQRVIAGGEIRVPGSDVGYYRLNERGLQTLKDNPYLTLTILDDPYQPNPGVKTYLVRHEYPSAHTFKRFENLLSEDLRNGLIELESRGVLKGAETEETRFYTQKILTELLVDSKVPRENIERYQYLMSIHPFSDTNGRTLRASFQARGGGTLFLRSFDNDLFLRTNELAARVREGKEALDMITSGFAKAEKENPTFPKYFNRSEPWQVLLGIDEPIGNPAEFTDFSKNIIKNNGIQNAISKKEYGEVRLYFWDEHLKRMNSLNEGDKKNAILSFVRSHTRPTPADSGLFRKLLEESATLAEKNPDLCAIISDWWGRILSTKPLPHEKTWDSFFAEMSDSRFLTLTEHINPDNYALNSDSALKIKKRIINSYKNLLGDPSKKATYLRLLARFDPDAPELLSRFDPDLKNILIESLEKTNGETQKKSLIRLLKMRSGILNDKDVEKINFFLNQDHPITQYQDLYARALAHPNQSFQEAAYNKLNTFASARGSEKLNAAVLVQYLKRKVLTDSNPQWLQALNWLEGDLNKTHITLLQDAMKQGKNDTFDRLANFIIEGGFKKLQIAEQNDLRSLIEQRLVTLDKEGEFIQSTKLSASIAKTPEELIASKARLIKAFDKVLPENYSKLFNILRQLTTETSEHKEIAIQVLSSLMDSQNSSLQKAAFEETLKSEHLWIHSGTQNNLQPKIIAYNRILLKDPTQRKQALNTLAILAPDSPEFTSRTEVEVKNILMKNLTMTNGETRNLTLLRLLKTQPKIMEAKDFEEVRLAFSKITPNANNQGLFARAIAHTDQEIQNLAFQKLNTSSIGKINDQVLSQYLRQKVIADPDPKWIDSLAWLETDPQKTYAEILKASLKQEKLAAFSRIATNLLSKKNNTGDFLKDAKLREVLMEGSIVFEKKGEVLQSVSFSRHARTADEVIILKRNLLQAFAKVSPEKYPELFDHLNQFAANNVKGSEFYIEILNDILDSKKPELQKAGFIDAFLIDKGKAFTKVEYDFKNIHHPILRSKFINFIKIEEFQNIFVEKFFLSGKGALPPILLTEAYESLNKKNKELALKYILADENKKLKDKYKLLLGWIIDKGSDSEKLQILRSLPSYSSKAHNQNKLEELFVIWKNLDSGNSGNSGKGFAALNKLDWVETQDIIEWMKQQPILFISPEVEVSKKAYWLKQIQMQLDKPQSDEAFEGAIKCFDQLASADKISLKSRLLEIAKEGNSKLSGVPRTMSKYFALRSLSSKEVIESLTDDEIEKLLEKGKTHYTNNYGDRLRFVADNLRGKPKSLLLISEFVFDSDPIIARQALEILAKQSSPNEAELLKPFFNKFLTKHPYLSWGIIGMEESRQAQVLLNPLTKAIGADYEKDLKHLGKPLKNLAAKKLLLDVKKKCGQMFSVLFPF